MLKKRAFVKSLTMINWRGIPYLSLEFDRLLTSLEGGNGAGKTTCLSAIYLALMPDMSMIKIAVIGENEGQKRDTGIHGRLGETAACYTILEIINPRGERVLAGVQLFARTAPNVEVGKLFIIERVPAQIPVDELFTIIDDDGKTYIADIQEMVQRVAVRGGDMRPIIKREEYWRGLFDLGVLPLRITDHATKEKFNRLLMTSLQGGFSENLQKRLKDYLFTEEPNVAGHVESMNMILQQCRQTRRLSENLSSMVESITTVHNMGKKMMFALRKGIWHEAQSLTNEKEALVDKLKTLSTEAEGHQRVLLLAEHNLRELEDLLKTKRKEFEEAKEHLDKTKEASRLQSRIDSYSVQISELEVKVQEAKAALDAATAAYNDENTKRSLLNADLLEIASRLADSQRKWEKISQESGLYVSACSALTAAQDTLPNRAISAENAEEIHNDCKMQKESLAEIAYAHSQRINNAELERNTFEKTRIILEQIIEEAVPALSAWDKAVAIDQEYREKLSRVADLSQTLQECKERKKLADSQKTLLRDLDQCGIHASTEQELLDLHGGAQDEILRLEKEVRSRDELASGTEKSIHGLKIHRDDQNKRACLWDQSIDKKAKLEQEMKLSLGTTDEIDRTRKEIQHEAEGIHTDITLLEKRREDVNTKINDLVTRDTATDPLLEHLEKVLDGQLVFRVYDEIELSEAAEKEARLGPLVNAILVDNIEDATSKLSNMKQSTLPDTIWLVEQTNLDREILRKYRRTDNGIIASFEKIHRYTKFPGNPIIGKEARKRAIADLRGEREALSAEINAKDLIWTQKKRFLESLAAYHTLAVQAELFSGLDPHKESLSLEQKIQFHVHALAGYLSEKEVFEGAKNEWALREKQIVEFLRQAYLLCDRDFSAEHIQLEEKVAQCLAAQKSIEQKGNLVEELRSRMHTLRVLPPSVEEIEIIKGEYEVISKQVRGLALAADALLQLMEKKDYFAFKNSFEQKQTMKDPSEELRKNYNDLQLQIKNMDSVITTLQEADTQAREFFSDVTSKAGESLNFKNELLAHLAELGVSGTQEDYSSALERNGKAQDAKDDAENRASEKTTQINSLKNEIERKESTRNEAKKNLQILARSRWAPMMRMGRGIRNIFDVDRYLPNLTDDVSVSTSNEAFAAVAGQVNLIQHHFTKEVKEPHLQDKATAINEKVAVVMGYTARPLQRDDLAEYANLWEMLMEYISYIIPRDYVHTDNAELAIIQIKDRLDNLEKLLADQEKDFQKDSTDIAGGIRAAINKERHKVNKANLALLDMGFGSIQGIKIDFKVREDMMDILSIIEDPAQKDLFTQATSLSDVMSRLYTEKIGGKVYGDDMLDYKNYVNISVKVLRKGSSNWVSSQLSTGEAIGTGASILVVILMGWEKSSSLLKDRDLANSLRILFMDEATRLDKDSIRVLRDFAKRMDIQLVLAGPKFEADECGSGFTYRLIRLGYDDGERVIVSGRAGFIAQADTALLEAATV